jgi:hypothetical protein
MGQRVSLAGLASHGALFFLEEQLWPSMVTSHSIHFPVNYKISSFFMAE